MSVTWARTKVALRNIRRAYKRMNTEAGKIPNLKKPEPKLTRETVSILSQNVWCSYFAGGGHELERLNLFADMLATKQYDVVFLQELFLFGFGRGGTDDILYRALTERMQDLGYTYHTDPFESCRNPTNVGQNSGLIAFSKYPFDLGRTYFESFKQRRTFSQKGFQHVIVEFGNDQLHFMNTHTEHKEEAMRSAQVVQMFNYIDRTFTNEKVVILGDFNTCAVTQPDAYSALQNLFEPYPNLFLDLGDSFRTEMESVAEEGVRQIDHVFTNVEAVPDMARHVDFSEDGFPVSDHLGLEFSLYINPAPDEIAPGKVKPKENLHADAML